MLAVRDFSVTPKCRNQSLLIGVRYIDVKYQAHGLIPVKIA